MSKEALPHLTKDMYISKYQVQRKLGQGAMGSVYLGHDDVIKRDVAIKVLHPEIVKKEPSVKARFLQEAQAAARCQHPNIINIFDCGSDQGFHFLVMEYLAGSELKLHLKKQRQPLPVTHAIFVFECLLSALIHAHQKGIIHRDIKPANVLIGFDGQIKLADFGVARLHDSTLTHTGMAIGTPLYMSPEALKGNPVDERSDLYSLGIVFFELLTQRLPQISFDLDGTLSPILKDKRFSGDEKKLLKNILSALINPISQHRYASAQACLDELQRYKKLEDFHFHVKRDDPWQPFSESVCDIAQKEKYTRYENKNNTSPEESTYLSQGSSHQGNNDSSNQDIHHHEIHQAKEHLTQFLGPIANYLIEEERTSHQNVKDLYESLAKHIPNEEERTRFLGLQKNAFPHWATPSSSSSASNQISPHASTSNTPPNAQLFNQPQEHRFAHESGQGHMHPMNAISIEQFQQISQLLSYYIGPLAQRLVRLYFLEFSTVQDFIQKLTQSIPSDQEQKAFLREVHQVIKF